MPRPTATPTGTVPPPVPTASGNGTGAGTLRGSGAAGTAVGVKTPEGVIVAAGGSAALPAACGDAARALVGRLAPSEGLTAVPRSGASPGVRGAGGGPGATTGGAVVLVVVVVLVLVLVLVLVVLVLVLVLVVVVVGTGRGGHQDGRKGGGRRQRISAPPVPWALAGAASRPTPSALIEAAMMPAATINLVRIAIVPSRASGTGARLREAHTYFRHAAGRDLSHSR